MFFSFLLTGLLCTLRQCFSCDSGLQPLENSGCVGKDFIYLFILPPTYLCFFPVLWVRRHFCFSHVNPDFVYLLIIIQVSQYIGIWYWSLRRVSLPADLNECEEFPDSCPSNTTCVNTEGSYYCVCNPGYEHTLGKLHFTVGECQGMCLRVHACVCVCALSCTMCFIFSDHNECTETVNPCGSGGTCLNLIGNFTCTCHQGYVKDFRGHSCLGENVHVVMKKGTCPLLCVGQTPTPCSRAASYPSIVAIWLSLFLI